MSFEPEKRYRGCDHAQNGFTEDDMHGMNKRNRTMTASEHKKGRSSASSSVCLCASVVQFVLCLFFVGSATTLVGCSDAQKRAWKPRSAEENYRIALESQNADERRDAVARIGENSYYWQPEAFEVLDAVARTDPAEQVRCIAVRVLARYVEPRPVPTLLAILTATEPGGQAIPAGDDLRWEACRALIEFQRRGLLAEEQEDAACEAYLTLRTDRSRNVRIASIEALGEFRDRRVLTPLISTLRSEDFMLADTAERSLMSLTGVTHEYDADAWREWVEKTPDPFAHAGEDVATSRPAGPTWWDKQQRVWRKAMKLSVD